MNFINHPCFAYAAIILPIGWLGEDWNILESWWIICEIVFVSSYICAFVGTVCWNSLSCSTSEKSTKDFSYSFAVNSNHTETRQIYIYVYVNHFLGKATRGRLGMSSYFSWDPYIKFICGYCSVSLYHRIRLNSPAYTLTAAVKRNML